MLVILHFCKYYISGCCIYLFPVSLGSQRGNTAAGTASAIMKSRPHGSQTSQVFTRPSMMRPPATPLPRSPKTPGPAKKLTEAGQLGRDTKGQSYIYLLLLLSHF